jgi:ligand-binding SRPBCC domain-containing protein
MIYTLERELILSRTRDEVFEFFSQASNLQKITPPWMHFHILRLPAEMKPGARIAYALRVRGIPIKWLTEIEQWNPPYEFVDVQLKGPYKLWRHTHRFTEVPGGTRVEDHVEYELPFGWIGRAVHFVQVARDLGQIFDYRTKRVRELLA